ncbi:MAG: ABC transporter ATP-binding protein [Kiritimatiellae bacterium]|nr:ABC transporter ATP-binding protein [Kiritimatiellia bacterium]
MSRRFGRDDERRARDPRATFLRLLGLLADRRREVALLLPPLLLATAGALAWPRAVGLSIDLMGERPVPMRAVALALLAGLALRALGLWAQAANGRATTRLSVGSARSLRAMLFSRVLPLPVAEFDRTRHGEFMSRLANDTAMAGDALGQGVLQFFSSCFSLAGTLGYMVWICPPLALVACATLPLTFLAGRRLAAFSRRLYRARQKAVGELNAQVEETVSGLRTVQAFGREAAACEAFDALSGRVRALAFRAEAAGGAMGPLMNAIGNLSFLLVAAAGGAMAIRGAATVGTVVSFLLYARQVGRPVNELAAQFGQIQSAIAGAERVFETADLPPETDEGRGEPSPDAPGAVRFEDVRFGYDPAVPVLDGFTLDVPAGAKVALVGETGSGKTTVIGLLARFHDPQAGRVLLDGADVRSLSKAALRRSLAIVLQDVHLFAGTVAENIAFGRPDATRGEIEAAARLADADGFVRRLPRGYDTPVGLAGAALSQGQRQLLSIARAALAAPKVLVLDEATSSVDARTERRIQAAMRRLLRGRTSLVVAHRLSTVRDADKIVVLDRGRIAGEGTHEELLRGNAAYRRLCGVA